MNLYIKQRVFTLVDTFDIYDQDGNPAYYAEGKLFSFGAKISVTDTQGREVVYVEQELFHFMSHYNVYRDNNCLAQIQQHFQFFGASFDIESEFGDFTFEGELFVHDFTLYRNGQVAMTVTKEWMSWGDSYELKISDSEDFGLMLGIVIAMDNAIHNGRRN